MNVGYENLSTSDVATILGVTKTNVAIWCRKGYIKYINVGEGNIRPRYMFTEDEVERIRRLMEKHGRQWPTYVKDEETESTAKAEVITTMVVDDPENYIPDDTDEITGYIKKIRALKVQRDKLLAELDSIDESIKTMREKVIAAI